MTVDTLEIAKELESAGMAKPHAEAVSRVVGRLAYDELVTRNYLDSKVADLRTLIAELRAELIRLLLAQIAIFTAIVALFRFWPS